MAMAHASRRANIIVSSVLMIYQISEVCGAQFVPLYEAPPGKGVHHEYFVIPKSTWNPNYPGITARFAQLLADKYNVTIKNKYTIGKFHAVLVNADLSTLSEMRENIREIEFIENNQILEKDIDDPVITDMDEEYCFQQDVSKGLWGLGRISYRENPDDFNSASYKYQSSQTGSGVDIYVVDTGVNIHHQEFEHNRAVWGYTANGLKHEGDTDRNGHGTHVASIAAGKNVGVAKEAKIIAVKVLDESGSGYTSYTVEALEWIQAQVESQTTDTYRPKVVINLSLGSEGPVPSMDTALENVIESGIPACVAAGNSDADACNSSPSRVQTAITVGATDWTDHMTTFSNWGSCLDLSAPGAAIKGAYINGDTKMAIASGTSQASPFVAGVVARYLSSQANHVSPADVTTYLTNTTTPDVIIFSSLEKKETTPDLLLYMACETNGDETPPSSNSTTKPPHSTTTRPHSTTPDPCDCEHYRAGDMTTPPNASAKTIHSLLTHFLILYTGTAYLFGYI